MKLLVAAITLSLLLSGILVATGGEASENGKTVIDWWEEDSRIIGYRLGEKMFTHNITFEEAGETTLEIRHEGNMIEEHVVQVGEEEGGALEKLKYLNELEQEGSIEADIDAPDQVNVGDTEEIEFEITNEIEESQELSLYIDDEFELEVTVPRAGELIRNYHTFTYKMIDDDPDPPEDLLMEFKGQADAYYHRRLQIERPDGRLIELDELSQTKVGEFHETIGVSENRSVRENIYDHVEHYLIKEHAISREDMPDRDEIDYDKVLFGEAGEDWLEDPNPLKGEYAFTIALDGINLELEDGKAIFYEELEDDEDEGEIPGFKTSLLSLASIIAVAIYKKKKR